MAEISEPITRREQYLNAAATGETSGLPKPVTREEEYLAAAAKGGGDGYKLVSSVASDGVKTYRTLFTELMENVTISDDKTYLLKIFGNSPLYHETSRPTNGGRLGFYQTFNTGSSIFTDNIMLSKTSSEVVYIQSSNDVANMVPKNGIVVKLFSISVDSAI